MCGITGFMGEPASAEELHAVAADMAATLQHRGPDDRGTWAEPARGVAFGHTRLAIIDLSPRGHQPMTSADGRWVLTFNGEIYNHLQLRSRLESQGARFAGHSDTEVLLEGIARWGLPRTLHESDGMFALAAWDHAQQRLLLARDRLGEKPLYYGWQNQTFLFGSELKALRRHRSFQGVIDRGALAVYLRHNVVPTPYSIYTGISKLRPGTWVAVDPSSPGVLEEPIPYWTVHEHAANARGTSARPLQAWVDELEEVMTASVTERMVADVPLGAFLSGGIDSSTIVALMQASSSRPIRTFTIGFSEVGFDEAHHAKQVAAHLGTDHTELYVSPADAHAVVPSLPGMYDEPFADSSQLPTYLVAGLARQSVTVALSGDGGDELFGGYTRYTFQRALWRRLRRLPVPWRRAAAAALVAVPPARWDALVRSLDRALPTQVPRHQVGDKLHKAASVLPASSPEELYRILVSHWQEPGSVVLGAEEHPTALDDPGLRRGLQDPTEQMMLLDTVSYLPDDILTKVDRATMAVSLEARVPFLDPAVVELAWRMPLDLKIRAGEGKWVLRQLLDRYVPRSLVERPKMGFGIPLGEWLRGDLRSWAEDLLTVDRLRADGFFDVDVVRRRWQEHQEGVRDWKYHLWDVLMFQAWLAAQEPPPR